MARKLKISTLANFSSRLVKFHKLPNGTEIRLYRKKTGRRVRSDFTVKRKGINAGNISKHDNLSNVKDFLNEARNLLSTDIEARGLEMQLFGPDGNRVNGNTLLGTVRSFEPNITEDSDKALDLFITILENCGLEDITIRQAGRLYNQLNEILGKSLDISLIKNESEILSASI
jgi:hypothetical protein